MADEVEKVVIEYTSDTTAHDRGVEELRKKGQAALKALSRGWTEATDLAGRHVDAVTRVGGAYAQLAEATSKQATITQARSADVRAAQKQAAALTSVAEALRAQHEAASLQGEAPSLPGEQAQSAAAAVKGLAKAWSAATKAIDEHAETLKRVSELYQSLPASLGKLELGVQTGDVTAIRDQVAALQALLEALRAVREEGGKRPSSGGGSPGAAPSVPAGAGPSAPGSTAAADARDYAEAAEKAGVSLEKFTARVTEAKTRASDTLAQIARAEAEAAENGVAAAEAVAVLERGLLRGSKAYQRTALELAKVRAQHVEGAEAAALQEKAIENLERTLETQLVRDIQNADRSLSKLFDQLRTDLLRLPGPLGTVQEHFKKLDDNGQRGAASVAAMLGVTALLATAAAAVGTALAVMGKDTADTINQIDVLAKSAGTTAEELSRYRAAVVRFAGAGERSVELQDFAEAMNEVSTKLIDAHDPASEQARLFKTLGLEVSQLRGLKPAELFDRTAEAVARMKDPAEQTDAAMRLFGDDLALKLLPVLREGPGALERLRQASDRLGFTLSGPALQAARDFRAAWNDLTGAWTVTKETVGTAVLPALTMVTQATADFLRGLGYYRLRVTEGEQAAQQFLETSWEQEKALKAAALAADTYGGKIVDLGKAQREAVEAMKGALEKERAAQLTGIQRIIAERDQAVLAIDREYEAARRAGTDTEELWRLTNERIVQTRRNAELAISAERKKALAEEREKAREVLAARAESDAQLGEQMAQQLERDLEAWKRLQKEILTAGEDRITKSLRLEEERISEIERLASQIWTSETEVQTLISEAHRAGAEERTQIAADEARKREELAANEAKHQAELLKKQVTQRKEMVEASIDLTRQGGEAVESISEALLAHGKITAKEQWRLSQGVAIAEAVRNAALAVSAVFAAEPGELAIKTGAAIAAGVIAAGQVAAVVAAPPPKFELGGVTPEGVIRGSRHAAGGVPIEVEGGEVIASRQNAERWGGPEKLDALIRRGPQPAAPATIYQVYNGRVLGRVMVDQARLNKDFQKNTQRVPVGRDR